MRRRHRSKIIELLEFTYSKPTNTLFGRAMMFAYERPLLAESRRPLPTGLAAPSPLTIGATGQMGLRTQLTTVP